MVKEGVYYNGENLTINYLQTADNGHDIDAATSASNRSGLSLSANARNLFVGVLKTVNRTANANKNQENVLYDAGSENCVIDKLSNSGRGAYLGAGTERAVFLPASVRERGTGVRINSSLSFVADSVSTLTPDVPTYDRYTVNNSPATLQIRNSESVQAVNGFVMTLEVNSESTTEVSFQSDYEVADQTVSGSKTFEFVRRRGVWVLRA